MTPEGTWLVLLLLQVIPDEVFDELPAFSAAGAIAGDFLNLLRTFCPLLNSLPNPALGDVLSVACFFLIVFHVCPPNAISLMTSPARIRPAAPGTKGREPGICRLPSAAASSSQPVGFVASS